MFSSCFLVFSVRVAESSMSGLELRFPLRATLPDEPSCAWKRRALTGAETWSGDAAKKCATPGAHTALVKTGQHKNKSTHQWQKDWQ
jgi:hypothetical protein